MNKSEKLNIKRFKAIGHKLHPLVTVADKGLSNTVISEIMRALNDHELIKITVRNPDRDAKKALIESVCTTCGAQLIQSIGNTALLYKANPEPDPKLSNVLRYL